MTQGCMSYFSDSVKKIPKWNFWKFLVDPEGKVVRFWRTDEPMESVRQEATALVREIILKKRVELWWSLLIDTGHTAGLCLGFLHFDSQE